MALKMKILIVSGFGFTTGGAKRNLNILQEYSKIGIDGLIIPTPSMFYDSSFELRPDFFLQYKNLLQTFNMKLKIFEPSLIREFLQSNINLLALIKRTNFFNFPLKFLYYLKYVQFIRAHTSRNFDFLYNQNESRDTTQISAILGVFLRISRFSLLQLPPFYTNNSRLFELISRETMGNSTPNRIIMYFNRILGNLFFRVLYTIIFQTNTRVFTVSESILYEAGLKGNRYVPLKIGVATDTPQHEIIATKKYDFMYCARLMPKKGIFDVLYAFSFILNKMPEANLIICGNFSHDLDKKKYYEIVKKLGLENHVTYMGFVPEDELYHLISQSKCILYPSFEDSHSMTIIEALSLGTHVVAYNIPAVSMTIYGKLDAVHSVKTGDVQELATQAISVVLMDEKKYREQLISSKKSLIPYNDWAKAARSELEAIKNDVFKTEEQG
jgi:glycosyltransferase involved in cell wall biosynthesis